MRKFSQKFLAFLLTLALCLGAVPALAAETAAAIRLSKTQGTVSVTNSGGRSLSTRDNMRLYSGYHVSTSAEVTPGSSWTATSSTSWMRTAKRKSAKAGSCWRSC